MLPPIPPLSGMHVLVIHFPIALLLIAPVFVLLSLLAHKHRLVWSSAAMTLMVLGTIAACVATYTGEAAEEGIDLPDNSGQVLERHEALAVEARNLFIGLTVAYGIFLVYNRFFNRMRWWPFSAVTICFLAAYACGELKLVNAAHQGGRLVHEFGIRSATAETASSQPAGTGTP